MGKSPAKWIKAVLFGKKSSRTNISKRKEKIGNAKDVVVVSKTTVADFASHPPPSSHPGFNNVNRNEGTLEIENIVAENFQNDGGMQGCEDKKIQESMPQDLPSVHERSRREQAAMVVQGAFRGYLARRAYRALKGIIRLQALIRGHLVRRQAVATLSSMLGVVKFQALVRGRRVRHSDSGLEVQKKCSPLMHQEIGGKPTDLVGANLHTRMEKLSANVFIHKLLASSPTPMPLHVFYESGVPNSVTNWMDCWSAAQFWKPVSQTKKIQDSTSQRRQSNGQSIDPRTSRSKRTRRSSAANVESLSLTSTSEFEKPKRNFRKVSSHPAEPVQENPQIELEKVKRNLRKVHNPKLENPILSEAETENRKQSVEKKVLGASGHDDLEQENGTTSETMENETAHNLSNPPDTERISEPSATKVVSDSSVADQPIAVYNPPSESVGNDKIISGAEAVESKVLTENTSKEENIYTINVVSSQKEDVTVIDHQNSCRKAAIDVKEEHTENGSLNSPKLPSYMAATQSAKAKLRVQGSPRFGQDDALEKSNPVRRHSLPSLTHNKLSSQSPRTQRLVQSGSKGGNKGNRSLPSNGNAKVTQAEWKR